MDRTQRRWDTDTAGQGLANGAAFAPAVRQLQQALADPGWIAEDPDGRLLPHLQRACDTHASPWQLRDARLTGTIYQVTLVWDSDQPRTGRLRADIFALLGAIAESATFVQQRVLAETVVYDVCTGPLAEDTAFRPHGHLVQLAVRAAAVAAILAGRQESGVTLTAP